MAVGVAVGLGVRVGVAVGSGVGVGGRSWENAQLVTKRLAMVSRMVPVLLFIAFAFYIAIICATASGRFLCPARLRRSLGGGECRSVRPNPAGTATLDVRNAASALDRVVLTMVCCRDRQRVQIG